MKGRSLDDELALRIGLAAKQLPGVSTQDLLKTIIGIVGEPITQSKLARLRAKKLRSQGKLIFENIDVKCFDKAFALLKGRGVRKYLHPKPELETGACVEAGGSLRVACASNCGENINGCFSQCVRFLIYQVSPENQRLIDIREPCSKLSRSDRLQMRADLIRDCSLLYSTEIGAAATAKAVKVGIQPLTINAGSAVDALEKLRTVLAQSSPPPWLAKAMSKKDKEKYYEDKQTLNGS